ncbi:hypothetical protein [Paraburkholderia rhynchosiae]|uniref:Uncharacterized protein n=1 Tax=Paraburkholderia rhynchosiae TaxID=487049 RepID=A0A6J4ZX16_9BURK|nr:hypothetical protein [Paraburkholderia rhynchosiae]CAB3645512.1 hypothetical protein LMG27174_00820 [Paraburkholderia rhynchosiae]
MWIFLSDSFLSIVDASTEPGTLLVRARREGDIEQVFPGANVVSVVGRDYLFRAAVPRQSVAQALVDQVMNLTYPNFKSSCSDPHLHRAYAAVWSVMATLQPYEPYARTPRPNFRKHPRR